MPKAVSKRQYRMMQAIIHGGKGAPSGGRGAPPKSVAEKYSDPGKDAPDQHGENRGGSWNKEKKEKHGKKDKKEDVKKSFEQYYKGMGAGVIVCNDEGQVLLGQMRGGTWSTPGGHVDDGEDYDEAAHRELREEAGIVAGKLTEIGHFQCDGNDSKVFVADSYKGKVKDSDELSNLKFVNLNSALDMPLRHCSRIGLEIYAKSSLKKSKNLQDMVLLESLEKSVIRGGARSDVVYDISHGESLRLIGNGCFRFLKKQVEGMGDEDFKDIHLDTYVISLRKHTNDVYSGRISDGKKVVHQFTNKSLPQLCADVMSVFEWYSDEDEHVFDILDEDNLPDDAIVGGLGHLSDNYKRHNIGEIYSEMNNIRQEIRNGTAVDLQQAEHKIMKLFDQMEETVHDVCDKHNQLAREAGGEIEALESKLRDLQNKVDELNSRPTTVEAYQRKHVDGDKLHDEHYMYLPKPVVKIGAHGNIEITFEKGWTDMEKSNFLQDMKAKIIKSKRH